jgi:hypothetical protein
VESYGWPFDKINHPAIIRVEFDAFALMLCHRVNSESRYFFSEKQEFPYA